MRKNKNVSNIKNYSTIDKTQCNVQLNHTNNEIKSNCKIKKPKEFQRNPGLCKRNSSIRYESIETSNNKNANKSKFIKKRNSTGNELYKRNNQTRKGMGNSKKKSKEKNKTTLNVHEKIINNKLNIIQPERIQGVYIKQKRSDSQESTSYNEDYIENCMKNIYRLNLTSKSSSPHKIESDSNCKKSSTEEFNIKNSNVITTMGHGANLSHEE